MTIAVEVLPDRLAQVMQRDLNSGGHNDFESGFCVMEAVSYVAGEPWSDIPQCACPVIATFLRGWNDALPDDLRTDLLRGLIPRLVGTKSTPEVELKRSLLAADWLVRIHTPAWLRLAGLNAQAESLSGLPEITAMAQVPGINPAIEAVRRDAAAAWVAAGAAAGDAAWSAAGDASWVAAGAAAGDAAGDAAWSAAGDAAWSAAGNAAWVAAWFAVGADAGADAKKKLAPTVAELQVSALGLIEKMMGVTP
jgi:hypothetical protein